MAWKILMAQQTDTEHLLPLRKALWSHMSLEDHRNELQGFFKDPLFSVFVAKDSNDAIVAFAEVMQKPHANGCPHSPILFLEGIWTHPDFRRKGISRALIDAIESLAQERKIPALASDALIENTSSHSAHLAWGFKEDERVVCYSKPL